MVRAQNGQESEQKNPLGQRLDEAGERLMGALIRIEGDSISPIQIKEVVHEVYELFLAKYRPVLGILADLLPDKLVGEFKPVILAFLMAQNISLADKDVAKLNDEVVALRAMKRMRALKAHLKAEFSRGEAMQILLADIAKEHSVVTGTMNKLTSSLEKAKKRKSEH